jgi:hypothetical protein
LSASQDMIERQTQELLNEKLRLVKLIDQKDVQVRRTGGSAFHHYSAGFMGLLLVLVKQ